MSHPLEKFHFCPVCGAREFEVSGDRSKRCWRCGFEYFLNPSASAAALIQNDRGELLVAVRSREPERGKWDLPGGFCDLAETLEQGVCREVLEETGLTVDATEYLCSFPNTYLYSGFVVHTVDSFFRCRVSDFSPMRAMDDCGELMWVPLQDVCLDRFAFVSIRQGVQLFLEKFAYI
ncbi:MAG: NUDIX domain-containing protein [Bacteroidaceae bacterium]|nr:NUDIX domain-containing protein [Bacteroidaceae bacterium]MCF0199282.1 NUDIX domain-containing protein [Bacteroidaceae bacterium]